MGDLDIVQVRRMTGVAASTMRFYEEKGLVTATGRRGLRRTFDPSVIERLALIALGRAAGFSLDEIREVLEAGSARSIDKTRLAAKADELDRQIDRLRIMRDGLRHAVNCEEPELLECPHFRQVLKLAAGGRLKPGKAGPVA